MIRSRLLAGAACLLAMPLGTAFPATLAAQEVSPPMYPQTRSDGIVETIFGKEVADPYRWLENDVRNDPEVAEWVAAQNLVTDAYLETLPGNAWFKQKLGALLDYERFGIPRKAGSRYFYTRNSGLQNQSPLYVQDSLDSERRLLLDPNAWAKDGATALSDWTPSPDGKYLLYSVQDGGTDWRILRVLDVDTGEQLGDEIKWAKFTGLAWVGEEGFLYSRFPEPQEGQDFQALNYNQAVYYHKIGTPQSEDQLVFATPDEPKRGNGAGVTDDGRWAVISSSFGTDSKDEINVIDLAAREAEGWQPRLLVPGFKNAWRPIGSVDGTMYFVTNEDAPRYKLVSIDLDTPDAEWKVVVPETEQPIDGASIVGEKLVLTYLKDATTRAAVFALDGTPQSDIELGALGTAGGFGGEYGDPETFYTFTSFNQPGAIYRLNIETGEKTEFASPELTFDPEKYAVEQQFYTSKDGTRVPMFIVRKAELAATGTAAPTMLYGYGGFDISLTPGFSATAMAWLEAGGVYAVANIRGGGEYGKEWHDGGRLANKQNVFDDFIAAGEYLKAQGITTSDGLAIRGGSNGGLLVGAVTNQRPDLVDAAQAAVGVMDMLRFDRWTAGRYWVDDYGYPSKQEDFETLLTYSPYHNIRSGVEYPPVLVTTADTDDRVVPGHSFKYTAALQAADAGDKPHLIRIETRAGHGSGKPTDKVIEEGADVLSFLARWTGLEVPPAKGD
ncbi:prolyl oligopeptidase family serine peptidase [Allopontixanthobacter sediminis]|uniref:prolyl oligopeptidase n=1 Tax=Allopontixanthobacter sediminis TaxID=1689985 RepID=A0A845AZE7_9SPHN|nr:prolyl oligopeptidase family serine peptidase [Allopontixanthobacter sediminis]